MSSLFPDFQKNLLSQAFNRLVAGMEKVTVQRKSEKSGSGPETEYEWKDVYKDLDCNLQSLKSFSTTEFGTIPTGIADFTKNICFVPIQIQENDQITKIVIKADDRLVIGDEKFKVLRPNKYPSHQELICEPINE